MRTFLHAIDIIEQNCKAKLACMRVCPTHAIRVRDGKARANPLLCIDCGECIVACKEGAIKARTDPIEAIEKFRYKIAMPSPTLFGQFQMGITPSDIIDGLLAMGFDAVYDLSLESELINLAIRDYLDDYKGIYPLISSACPVVVRLIQVSYPDMVGQIIPIETPRELAGREIKKLYSAAMGLRPDEIGAVYITPCPAKVVAIKQPAEGVQSYIDLGISIADIYNTLLAAITKLKKNDKSQFPEDQHPTLKSSIGLAWAFSGGQCLSLKPSRYISVSQFPNIIRVFDDIEKGKIKGVEFVECYACTGGCIGGPLTVDDTFVSTSKIQKLVEIMGKPPKELQEEIQERYVKGDYFLRQDIKPRPTVASPISFEEKIRRMKAKEDLSKIFPGLDCGLCGAPTCNVFADDVANSLAVPDDCVLISETRLKNLRERYRTGMW
jgi:iron only hydrogenase large subunit-like protein